MPFPIQDNFPTTDSLVTRSTILWMPQQVMFTPAALDEPWGQQIFQRVQSFNLPIIELPHNRLNGLRGNNERQTYDIAKRTLAVVTAPPSHFKLSPIPPSADWQFHIAEGCPAHCQYCYLAGSLSGPPVIRAFANLPQILSNLARYEQPEQLTTYEVSCYTDPLGIEHLTGSLAECIRYFGTRSDAHLRWVSKFDAVDSLLDLPHNGHTRCRMSVNATPISRRFEGGTSSVSSRLRALRQLAEHHYPVGLVIAPIMPVDDWQTHYSLLFDSIEQILDFNCDLTFELISHRFTPNSKEVLQTWYPYSQLDMDEAQRRLKRNKFGGIKYVYDIDTMNIMKHFFEIEIQRRFPHAKILYWT
ncbi:spore photoproduct lyase (plasmid) [Anabaenopsis circularis NIES-21]|uniref:Spore photoproduct lyase n=1 Tax=Anabaenopsis circularis NIES-21 TaxID=1085406 RepID=A0A1Z4GRG7_9CYAN|nr:spore photoproduct lyase [Anabaenopsis circularis NIES-21]